jgi:nitrite reductase/ring-hydroxylating ferredoxin subunit
MAKMHSPDSTTGGALWHPTLPLNELAPGTLIAWKHDGRQLVLVHTEAGQVHALDNRCPHEGYPLSTGDLKGRALTCCWHNWKFDVTSGACLLGEEPVRSFPTRSRNGVIEVDLAEPDPRATWPGLLESFAAGLGQHQVARSARDGVRLLQSGFDPQALLARVALHDALHGEYGSTHALPVAADCGRFLTRYPGVNAMYAIAPAVDMCGEANQRLPLRERPAPLPGATCESLRAAVEAEDATLAEGLLRGAFEAGVPRAEIERWLFAVLSDHFLDFGHELIYLVKAQELFARAGDEHAAEIYGGLLYAILLGTREDTLPYMSGYFRRFASQEERLGELWRAAGRAQDIDTAPLQNAVLDGSLDAAMGSLLGALEAGASLPQLARALVAAAAQRFFRYDLAIDPDPDISENWLWVTHRFTFASAVRNAVERFESPDAIRFLVQAVAFVHGGRRLDAQPEERLSVRERDLDVPQILAAIAARDAATAVGGTLAALSRPERLQSLREALEDLCLRDPLVRPIVVTHAIKTLVAAFEEYEALEGHPDRAWPLLACVRFLASPIIERRVFEQVRRSILWVAEGKMPRKLTQ